MPTFKKKKGKQFRKRKDNNLGSDSEPDAPVLGGQRKIRPAVVISDTLAEEGPIFVEKKSKLSRKIGSKVHKHRAVSNDATRSNKTSKAQSYLKTTSGKYSSENLQSLKSQQRFAAAVAVAEPLLETVGDALHADDGSDEIMKRAARVAREKRQQHRAIHSGDFIPLDESTDHTRSSSDATNEMQQSLQQTRNSLLQQVDSSLHEETTADMHIAATEPADSEQHGEMEDWEREQIARGRGQGQGPTAGFDSTSGANSANRWMPRSQQVASGSQSVVGTAAARGATRPRAQPSSPAHQPIFQLSAIQDAIADALAETAEGAGDEDRDATRLRTELELAEEKLSRLQARQAEVGKRFEFFQASRNYLVDLSDCLTAKLPMLRDVENAVARMWSEAGVQLEARRAWETRLSLTREVLNGGGELRGWAGATPEVVGAEAMPDRDRENGVGGGTAGGAREVGRLHHVWRQRSSEERKQGLDARQRRSKRAWWAWAMKDWAPGQSDVELKSAVQNAAERAADLSGTIERCHAAATAAMGTAHASEHIIQSGAAADVRAAVHAVVRSTYAPLASASYAPCAADLAREDDSDEEFDALHQRTQELLDAKRCIFQDTRDEFTSVSSVKDCLEDWKREFRQEYTEAFATLSAPDVFAPLVRYELLDFDPVDIVAHGAVEDLSVMEFAWFQQLLDFGQPDPAEAEPAGGVDALAQQEREDDADGEVVKRLLERVVVARSASMLLSRWDPMNALNTYAFQHVVHELIEAEIDVDAIKRLVAPIPQRIQEAVEHFCIPLGLTSSGMPAPCTVREFLRSTHLGWSCASWAFAVGRGVLHRLVADFMLQKLWRPVLDLVGDVAAGWDITAKPKEFCTVIALYTRLLASVLGCISAVADEESEELVTLRPSLEHVSRAVIGAWNQRDTSESQRSNVQILIDLAQTARVTDVARSLASYYRFSQ